MASKDTGSSHWLSDTATTASGPLSPKSVLTSSLRSGCSSARLSLTSSAPRDNISPRGDDLWSLAGDACHSDEEVRTTSRLSNREKQTQLSQVDSASVTPPSLLASTGQGARPPSSEELLEAYLQPLRRENELLASQKQALQEEARLLAPRSSEIYGAGITALLAKVSEKSHTAAAGDFLRSRTAMAESMRRQVMANQLLRHEAGMR
eukprot:CAMPEP_0169387724 /NCGR_PEP_ID=MMETSP1017-20121227/45582_1 /TAXON_ID=342587 /ORGANISM="Karlodinium micrum, Strain CCMP2283" /LENGTH=206 /DNA_ID=CAMNT_0009489305 /DNA_START=17 /DNA_END=637 /DNA_ORIENTATION=-